MDLNSDTFTLRDLLGGELRLMIPDMQRDYCWGGADGAQRKVAMFVSALVELYTRERPISLGLLYGYEMPRGSQHLYIIDGQQRLTTLYLLVGMLYRRTPSPRLRQLLIGDYELLDDHTPRLIYQARSEALSFMSDLVINFFLDRNGRLSQLERSPWYYSAYDSDPSVRGFVGALRQIDTVLEGAVAREGWSFEGFAAFVTERLTFTYHDLDSRQKAEEIFVTINTTGEPLTYPQAAKAMWTARAADPSDAMARWEQMERWAWSRRLSLPQGQAPTSDALMERFLGVWTAYTAAICPADTRQDHPGAAPTADFDSLHGFFLAYRTLTDCLPQALELSAESAESRFRLLPSLAYICRWRDSADGARFDITEGVTRLWTFLTNITRYQKASAADTLSALDVVARMPSPALTSLLDAPGRLPERIVNSEERAKLLFLARADKPGRAYRLLLRAQDHPVLNGRVEKVLGWCRRADSSVDLDALAGYIDTLYQVWDGDIDMQPGLDHVRVALLTLRHKGYPIVRRGDTSLSLCWHQYDWQRLMLNAPGLVRQLLDRLRSYKVPVRDALRQMASRFTDRTSPYYFLIKSPALLQQCAARMLMRPSAPFLGYYVYGQYDSQGRGGRRNATTRWFVEQLPLPCGVADWGTFRSYGSKCLYTDHRSLNLSIDLYHTPGERDLYRVEVFCRNDSDPSRQMPGDIAAWVRSLGYPVRFDTRRKRHCTYLPDARAAVAMVRALMGVR